MRLKLNILLALYCLCVLTLALLSFGDTEATEATPKIDIATLPKDILFNISNTKPGDTAFKTLTIQNNGNKDFNYTMESSFQECPEEDVEDEKSPKCSEELYKQLLLQVSDKNGLIYDGNLSDFSGLEKPRFLANFKEEDLTLRVEFPWESGNEFQGLATSFLITLVAEGKDSNGGGDPPGPPDPPDTPKDPPGDSDPPDPPKENDPPKLDPLKEDPTAADILEENSSAEEQEEAPPNEEQEENLSSIHIPEGIPSVLPKTGEINPAYFYLIGLFIALIGFILISMRRLMKRHKE